MKTLGLFLLLAAFAAAEPRTLFFTGTFTNTTGDIAAPARLELIEDGEKLSAKLVTLPPLTGTGSMAGRCLDGWCELTGALDGGFTVKFRGVLNARSFRGTYTATPAKGETQYGRFEFFPTAAGTAPASNR